MRIDLHVNPGVHRGAHGMVNNKKKKADIHPGDEHQFCGHVHGNENGLTTILQN